ncbi:ADP-ribosylglycohydrolase family protein [Hamadaea tsunoensis]|uniref:ADP-ribosylglycohydrolase family protein n=1 Tax=Hamadaea tsunoensis TaxID=53368 RepID=UPI000404F10A|nr:ADP-ribosylglycohydrolase family protein [Hamadaea tsunoensis]
MLTAEIRGCLAGAAVGDALGGAVEGALPGEIRAHYGGPVTGPVAPIRGPAQKPTAPYSKGYGRVTDDTLMTLALVRAYQRKRDHLDAFDVAEILVPDLLQRPVWIPDLEREAVTLHRLAAGERYLVSRVHHAHADPREAGSGNAVNCGAAMYAAPVGVINAGDPRAAYAEAIEVASPHQHSYGREAAGVMAACVAAALPPSATVDDVIDAALAVAHDGTRAAISAVVSQAREYADQPTDSPTVVDGLRRAVAAYDTVGEKYAEPGLGARRPSRLHAIEELPIALGMLVVAGGAYAPAVLGAVNYGRDADSTATMAGAIAGALHGFGAIPADWAAAVEADSRLDFAALAADLSEVADAILRRDAERYAYRAKNIGDLLG